MNLTLSIDEQLLEKARKHAAATGTTVNQMVRDYFEAVTGEKNIEAEIARFHELSGTGDSNGWRWNREEVYEERTGRYGKP
jgi:hypothetical protein